MAKIFISLIYFVACHPAQTGKPASEKFVQKWVEQKKWAKGLAINLHPSVNKDSFYVAYHRNQLLWDSAFSFLKNQDLPNLKPGKYTLLGDQVFATVSEAPSHSKEEVQWESHRKYIDLQYIIKGKETIGVADISTATVTRPYSGDAINYKAEGNYYVAAQDAFFLFFPNDAHRPTIRVEGYDIVKKIVIKIQVDQAM